MESNEPYHWEAWTVWYRDTFDLEAPPRIDVKGQGLANGLAELWARHLFETVQAGGQEGFSRFHLEWKHGKLSIQGDWDGAKHLRRWLFGLKSHSTRGYAKEADPVLLGQIAHVHACLIDRRDITGQILALAAAAQDSADFTERLLALLKEGGQSAEK